jgi:hypothetical protein
MMKRIVGAVMVTAALTAPGLAADLGARTYTKAPAMASPATNWSGLYLGGNVGYGWGTAVLMLLCCQAAILALWHQLSTVDATAPWAAHRSVTTGKRAQLLPALRQISRDLPFVVLIGRSCLI